MKGTTETAKHEPWSVIGEEGSEELTTIGVAELAALRAEFDQLKECHDDHYRSYRAVCRKLADAEAEIERLRGALTMFVSLDWDGIIADMGGMPNPPDRFYGFEAFLQYARAAARGE